jgi:hypothetical protein
MVNESRQAGASYRDRERIAKATHAALSRANPHALIMGGDDELDNIIIDGKFNLFIVAKFVLDDLREHDR